MKGPSVRELNWAVQTEAIEVIELAIRLILNQGIT